MPKPDALPSLKIQVMLYIP